MQENKKKNIADTEIETVVINQMEFLQWKYSELK